MNPFQVIPHVAASWRHCVDYEDKFRLLSCLRNLSRTSRERIIAFRYPQPTGFLRLALRANGGVDCFHHCEVFEREYYRLPLGRTPATVLDVGAGIGLTAVYFSRLFPQARLACVEPDPESLCVLARNLSLNGVRARGFQAAVRAADGQLLIKQGAKYVVPPATFSSGLYAMTTSIPAIIASLGWDRIGLLKVDLPGAEADLLSDPGDWINLVDVLCIKSQSRFGDVEFRELASRFGFLPPRQRGAIWLLMRPM
jgi:FkbM family methyltransferase